MAVEFVQVDQDTPDLFPPSVQEYLPEKHLARFVVEIVDQLDVSHLVGAYACTGPKPYHPAILVALFFCGYATGVFSSRKLAQVSDHPGSLSPCFLAIRFFRTARYKYEGTKRRRGNRVQEKVDTAGFAETNQFKR